jgi:hypothetical protein
MANNRLYIVNSRTGARLMLAKSNSPIGWRLACSQAEFDVWMVGVDMSSVEGDSDTILMLDTDVTDTSMGTS